MTEDTLREGGIKLINIIRKEFPQLFFVVLSFVLMVVVSYYFVSEIVQNQIFANSQEGLNAAEATIRSDLREAEVTLLHTGLLVEDGVNQGKPLDEIQSYLTLITTALNSEGTRVPGFLDVYGYIHYNFISGLNLTSPKLFIPQYRYWYSGDSDIGFTSPFLEKETGSTVISLTRNLKNDRGEQYGSVTLDLDFTLLADYIKSLNFAGGGYGILADENFNIIVHPLEQYIDQSLEDINPGYAKMAQELRENPGTISTLRLSDNGNGQVMLISKQMYNGWFLGIACPVSRYYGNVNSMALTLSGLGIIFMIILNFILIQLSLSKARSDEENMEKSSFLARMSHEIRTPMNSILGMAELIQRKAVSSEIKEYIEIIQNSGNTLLTIINDILDFSKIESQRLQLQNHNYYIASVINDMVNMIRPRVAEKSLDFLVNVDSSIPIQLYGDDMRLRQILTNLLSNAVKYTRRGFISLDIWMERINEKTIRLVCAVQDSGIGIKVEDQQKLFKEFSRIEAKANQGIQGTGLGLVISQALCCAMGGDITLTSEYHKGSVFKASIIQEFDKNTPIAQVNSRETKQVLFYDWRPHYVDSMTNMFKSLGVTAVCSEGFQEFIKDLENGDYNYSFISSKYAMDCIHVLGKRTVPLQLVIMVEPGETSVYRDITSILMPVYSITMANVLNDVFEGVQFADSNLKIHFTSPSSKILIVDDISTNLRVAKELMAPYEMNVHTALSGPEALGLIKNNYYDLVFMDHMMPGMDGLEATALIRGLDSEDDYYSKLPIIALTANVLSDQQEMFLENGIDDFLAKPIDVQKLNDILEKWLPAEKLIKSSQAVSDTKSAEEEPLVIPGVDVELGLRNSGSTRAVFLNILTDFCKDVETRLIQISDALDRKDTGLYITLVHAIKGAARSIGAVEVGEKAAWLENEAPTAAPEIIREKTEELDDELRNLIIYIRSVAAEADNGADLMDISVLRLEALKTALEEMDIEAVNRMLLAYASLSLDAKTKNIMSEVEQYILMFEFEKAIEKINEL